MLLLGLRALEGLDQLLEGELHGGPHPALPGLPLSLWAHGPLLLLHSRRHLEPWPLLLLLLLLSPLVLLGPAHHGHLLHRSASRLLHLPALLHLAHHLRAALAEVVGLPVGLLLHLL